MPDAPRTTVIIVTWNALPLIRRFLPSVLRTDYSNLEVIVADNASTDGTAEWVRENAPNARVIRHPENWRFCRGNNEAIARSDSKYVVLLNNDVEVPPDWLAPLVAAMEASPDLGAVQPKIRQIENPLLFEYAGAAGGFLDSLGYPFARGRLFDHLEQDSGQYDAPRDIFWASGAAVVLRRAALAEVGLLDERLEMHMEEIDLCWRLWRAGWRVRSEPASTVFHLGGGSLARGHPQKTYYNFRNSFLLLHRHLPPALFRKTEALRYAVDTVAASHALLTGRPADCLAIARAHRDYRALKRVIPPLADQPYVLPPFEGSIVLDHFLRRKLTFADLEPARFRPGWRPS
jgi:GT2 family glycosyltransferase